MNNKISSTIPLTSGFTDILLNIAAQGFDYIKISYSGSGDSGCIEDVYLAPKGKIIIDDDGVNEYNDRDYAYPDDELNNLLQDKAYAYVLDDADDWYNNEGGGGELYISTLDGSFYCNHYTYELISKDTILTGKFGDA